MSFRLKTILGVALIEGALLLLLVWTSLDFLTRSSQEELVVRAETTSRLFASLIKDAVLSTDLATLDEAVEELRNSRELSYVRVRRGDAVLAQAGDATLLARPFVGDAQLVDVDDGVFDVTAGITEAGTEYGRVELGLAVQRFEALLEGANRRLKGIAIVEMILVALFSYMLGAYLTRGLGRIERAAHAISDGELGTQVTVSGRDELAEAARAFNDMSLRLAESHESAQRSMEESLMLSAQLAEREQHLSIILNTAVDGFVTISAKGVIESINSAGARMFGYEKAELIGRNVSLLMPETDADAHDGNLAGYLDTGVAGIIGVGREVMGRRKDGSLFPLDLAVSEMQLGGRRAFVALVRDITERKRSEAVARKSTALMSAVVDANIDALITTDIDDHVVEWSPVAEQVFGYARDEVLGKPMSELIIPPAMRAMHREGMARFRRTHTGQVLGNRIEVEALRRNGETFPVELTVQAIEVDGEILFTAFLRDITERKAAEAALTQARQRAEAASEAKSRFLAHMSHEIRSPLNAVLGSMGLLLDEELSREQRLYAKTAQTSGNSLLSLINDILDFSKIEAGELALDHRPFDLDDLLSDIADLVSFRARGKPVQTAIAMAPGLERSLVGDPVRVRQILVNLMDNALKFTEQGAVVLLVEGIGQAPDSVRLRFRVEDTGIGIPADAQPRLFDEFRQVDNSDSTRYGGTGLGLSICEGLCRGMGGSIALESEPGAGTRFTVELPFTRGEPVAQPASPAGERRVLNPTVLIVGLHPLVRQAVRLHCQTPERCAEMVDTVAEGMRAMSADKRVVLVDGNLPEVDLARLAREARARGIPHRVLINPVMTGAAADWVRNGHFDDLLVMPLLLSRLIDLVRSGPQGKLDLPDEYPAESSDASPMDDVAQASGARLLLAEDSTANQMVAKAMLNKAGYQVDIAENGQQAVAAFAATDYDLVLMDLRMPEMDGLAATRAIRSTARGRETPIIALTANALREEEQRCMAAGMNDYVTKPVDRDRLLATIERWLQPGPAAPAEAMPSAQPGEAALLDGDVVDALARDTSPEVVPQMLALFASEIRERVDRISGQLHSLTLGELEDESHTVKSCAGTFGAARLQAVAGDMEQACREGRREEAEQLGSQLSGLLQETMGVFRERFEFLDRAG